MPRITAEASEAERAYPAAPSANQVQVVFAPDGWARDRVSTFQKGLRALADEHGWPRKFVVVYGPRD